MSRPEDDQEIPIHRAPVRKAPDSAVRPEDPAAAVRAPGEEEEDVESSFAADMGRLFLIPALIVGLSVVIFVLFGWIAGERRTAGDYLQEVRHGTTGRKWQAAFELSRVLARDREALEDPAVASEIVGILQDPATGDPRVRRYLILALEQIGNPATAPAIRESLSDGDVEVRLFAARALGHMGDREAVPALVEMLAAEDPGLRKMALHALGRIGESSAAPAMRARLDDPVEDVRWNAALGLAVLGDPAGSGVIRQMLDPAYLEAIPEITDGQKIEARLNAVHAAWLLGGPEMRALVEEVGAGDSSLRVRDSALKAVEEWR
jgi:HEAT repeat protein